VEEMSADRAADVLADLDEKASEDILDEMEHDEQEEVRELLEFEEDSAGGMMGTEYIALPKDATVGDAISALRSLDEVPETLSTIFLIDNEDRLQAAVSVARLFLHESTTPLLDLVSEKKREVSVHETQERVLEIFDKYNLRDLPVVDEDGKLTGVIHVDDVVTVLRQQ